MRSWKRTSGFLFLVVLAVYSVSAGGAGVNDPFAPSLPSAAPSTLQIVSVPDSTPAPSPAPGVAGKVIANDDGTYGFHFPNDSNIVDDLQKIAAAGQISIIPSKDVRGTIPAIDLYNVKIPAALNAILSTNGYAYEEQDGIIRVFSQKELSDRQKLNLELKIYRLYYVRAADVRDLIKPVLSPEGQVTATTAAETGIQSSSSDSASSTASNTGTSTGTSGNSSSSSSSDTGGDSYASQEVLVVTDHPENQERVRQVIAEIDHKPKEILIEATILSAELTDNNSLGIDFSVLGGVSLNNLPFTPANAGLQAASGNVPAIGVGANKTGFTAVNSGTGGLQIGVVYNNIAVFLNALESVTNTTILANPKVLTLDKQHGSVHVGQTLYYYDTTVTQNAQTQAAQSLPTGITLDIRPFIEDNGSIRMEIHPQDSSGTILPSGLPQTDNTEVATNVIVQDGHTILIGGLFNETSQISKTQTPFLGSLPWIGALFRQQADSTDRREIIFLITPHIVSDDDALDTVSREELKDIERFRVGVRQGMMPFSRERLAESSYEAAEAELQKPHPDLNLVRWHLDCATNLNPTFLEAIKLKEQVTGQELAVSDNSSIRGFIRREMLEEEKRKGNLPQVPADTSSGAVSNEPLEIGN